MMGIQAILMATKRMTKDRPTTRSSVSEGLFLNLVQTSMVKIVEEELKIDVRDDIRAAIITANMRPFRPDGISSSTSLTYAMFVQPDSELQIFMHSTGLEQATYNSTVITVIACCLSPRYGRGPWRPSLGKPRGTRAGT